MDARNGLNSVEGEAQGSGTQPVLSGNGDETARLGRPGVGWDRGVGLEPRGELVLSSQTGCVSFEYYSFAPHRHRPHTHS